jgi:hypothetical protein
MRGKGEQVQLGAIRLEEAQTRYTRRGLPVLSLEHWQNTPVLSKHLRKPTANISSLYRCKFGDVSARWGSPGNIKKKKRVGPSTRTAVQIRQHTSRALSALANGREWELWTDFLDPRHRSLGPHPGAAARLGRTGLSYVSAGASMDAL